MDMQDGMVDGIPETLMEEQDIQHWLELYEEKANLIQQNSHAGLRRYAKTAQLNSSPQLVNIILKIPTTSKENTPNSIGHWIKSSTPTPIGFNSPARVPFYSILTLSTLHSPTSLKPIRQKSKDKRLIRKHISASIFRALRILELFKKQIPST